MTSEEPPEEPQLYSEPAILSPASPKPVAPIPPSSNIPVLINMMDVDFNQTEPHMQDPSMRNTELRDGVWKEPETEELATTTKAAHTDDTMLTAMPHDKSDPAPIDSLNSSDDVKPATVEPEIVTQPTSIENSLHATLPVTITPEVATATPLPAESVDVQSLLSFLQKPPQSVTPQPAVLPTSTETTPNPPLDLAAALLNIAPAKPPSRVPSSQREQKIAAGEPVTEDDAPWDASIQAKYDDFIQEERKHVNAGNWDGFPTGSRLFVGNLNSDSVTKRDIFHVFHSYGPLAQISIKQAYGFVQFLHAADCARALSTEQGRLIRDKRVHLEVSKPQKSRNQNNNNNNNNRNRSRSPANRNRRDARRYRSPSPRDYRHDSRRSRSPPGRSYRSPSPRDDDLPLPRRAPQDVPDIQVVVRGDLDRDFIAWVEKAFSGRGLRIAVLLMAPRLDEDAVMRRQIVEGVLAVSRLDRQAQNTGKISLRVFNRSRGQHNVTFDDYDNLDPSICAELVLRAKSQAAPQTYGYTAPTYPQQPQQPPQYSYAPPQFVPPPQAYPPQYSAPAPTQVDLQNMMVAARNGATPAGYPPGYPPQPVQYAQVAPPQTYAYQSNAPAFAAPAQQPRQAPPGDMQDILARLGNYK